ncbi:ECF transporter S component, folate family [Alkalibacterium subtropicum]|uniref:ECF transporter S component, folate family n=1 Tax=Alkalibacterium subtropicum TaxID=753702 RepID=A0A1I1LJ47_9LACT|nr:folate family ECF transporter S component [Alkalibacterium subtropicum]SFC73227.1 ECF transporter S component, folate family [Alkalibacterium subtropicum]
MNETPNQPVAHNTKWDYALIGIIAPLLLSFVIPFLRSGNGAPGAKHFTDQYENWEMVLADSVYLFVFTGILFSLGIYVFKRLNRESTLIGLLIGLLLTGGAYFLFLQNEILGLQGMGIFEGNGVMYGIVFLFYGWMLLFRVLSLSKWDLDTRGIAIVGVLMAMAIALGRVGITTPIVRITFSFLPTALIGILFGPWVAGVAAALGDILGFIIGGGVGGFFPGFTLSAFLGGVSYGVFLHKKKVTKKRVLMAVAFNTLFVNLTLNTLWLYILTQNPLAVLLPPRLLQNAVMSVVRFLSIWFIANNKQLRRVYMKYSTAKS